MNSATSILNNFETYAATINTGFAEADRMIKQHVAETAELKSELASKKRKIAELEEELKAFKDNDQPPLKRQRGGGTPPLDPSGSASKESKEAKEIEETPLLVPEPTGAELEAVYNRMWTDLQVGGKVRPGECSCSARQVPVAPVLFQAEDLECRSCIFDEAGCCAICGDNDHHNHACPIVQEYVRSGRKGRDEGRATALP